MVKQEKQLFIALKQEDDVGLVIRGHLHIEHQLTEYISKILPYPEKCDWEKVGYSGKVELALSCGLPSNIRPILEKLGELRNDFTSNLDAMIEPNWVLDTYSSLPKHLKSGLEKSYKTMDLDLQNKTSKLNTKDLLVLIFISVCRAITPENKAPSRTQARQRATPVTTAKKQKAKPKISPPRTIR